MTDVNDSPSISLERRLRARLGHAPSLLAGTTATVVIDVGDGQGWTVHLRGGEPRLERGHARGHRPTSMIRTDPFTLAAILDGKQSGVDAFLDGRLTTRGSLALALKTEALFGGLDRPPPLPRARVAHAGDVTTFYLEAGVGPPVVLLHGLGATNASLLPTLRALSRDYRVIAPDLPGFGDSSKPLRRHHAAYQASWLVHLLDTLEIPRAHLVGNSMGGRLALEVALSAPERVDRLALLAPSMAFLRGRAFAPLVRALLPELALLPLPAPRALTTYILKKMFARPERLRDAWYTGAVDEFSRVFATPRGRIAFFSAMRQIYLEEPRGPNGFWTRLGALSRPALFIWGDRDVLVPARFARHVVAALPTATSVVLETCGHVPQYELPERTHELVREFFAAGAAAGGVGRARSSPASA